MTSRRNQPVLNRQQEMLLSPCVDEYVSQNNPVRAIDAYVVNNGTVKKVEVKTGLRDEHSTELLNSSIKEADTIVVQGKELVSDGASVQVKSL